MQFKNKQELVDFIHHQLNIQLVNDKMDRLNKKRNILYTQLPSTGMLPLLSLLHKYNIRHESHRDNYYWIWVK